LPKADYRGFLNGEGFRQELPAIVVSIVGDVMGSFPSRKARVVIAAEFRG
jgi:hypothetical protein